MLNKKDIEETKEGISKNEKIIQNDVISDDVEEKIKEETGKNIEDEMGKGTSEEYLVDTIDEKSEDTIGFTTDNEKLKEMISKVQKNSKEINILESFMCKWYRVFNLTFITEDLFGCYNNLSFVYNYDMNNAFYKYSHYLLGIEEENNKIGHLYFGIPSRFGIEPHPFLYVQQYSNWFPVSEESSEMGDLGYWLIKIDSITGQLKEF